MSDQFENDVKCLRANLRATRRLQRGLLKAAKAAGGAIVRDETKLARLFNLRLINGGKS